ncbi:MAG: DinB family protein [Aquihabitans sp.]
MDVSELLVEGYGRLPDLVRGAVADLDLDQLVAAPGPGANTVAWLVWHLTRVQDHHISEILDAEQRYISESWHQRFGRGPDPQDHGYGHTEADVAAVQPQALGDLTAYYDSVHARTIDFLSDLGESDLDRVVDEGWDPPVTMGARLTSILNDDLQHVGQAAYVRGLLVPES